MIMKRLLICANLLLSVNGFTMPNSRIKKQIPRLKYSRKIVVKNFSIGEQDILSPSELTRHIYDEVSKYGIAQSYNDFQISLQNHPLGSLFVLRLLVCLRKLPRASNLRRIITHFA